MKFLKNLYNFITDPFNQKEWDKLHEQQQKIIEGNKKVLEDWDKVIAGRKQVLKNWEKCI